jgi:hypothetical protein
VTANDEFAGFEFADDRTDHHQYLLCLNGGKVIDISPSAVFEGTIADNWTPWLTRRAFSRTASEPTTYSPLCRLSLTRLPACSGPHGGAPTALTIRSQPPR